MVGFVNAHKVVVLKSTFSTLANAQNENVLKMRTFFFKLWKIEMPIFTS
jgi:hypothetical protein